MRRYTTKFQETDKPSLFKRFLNESVYVFICLLWFRGIFVLFNGNMSDKFGYNTSPVTVIYYGIMHLLLIFSIPHIVKRAFEKSRYIIFYMFIFLLGYIQGSLNVYSKLLVSVSFMDDIKVFAANGLYSGLLLVVIALSADDYKKLAKAAAIVSCVGIIMALFTDIIRVFVTTMKSDDDMNFAYYLCFFTCYLLIYYMKHRNPRDLVLSALGIILLLFSGTRGPIMCVIVSFAAYFLTNKNTTSNIIIVVLTCVVLWFLSYTGLLGNIIRSAYTAMGRIGFSTRIFDYATNNMLSDSSGRDTLQAICWRAIEKKPFTGMGIGYDRVILKYSYCHNFIIEMFLCFGIPGGIVLVGLIVISLLKGLKSEPEEYRMLCAWFAGAVVVRLMFSSSFLILPDFYIMIGILLSHGYKYIDNEIDATKQIT